MSISLLQEDTAAGDGGVSGTTLNGNALGSNATIGSTMVAWVTDDGSGAISTVKDSANQSYSLLGSKLDATNQAGMYCYQFANNQSATALSMSIVYSSSIVHKNVHLQEIGGAKSSGADVCAFSEPASPGTGANAITVSATPGGSQPYFASAAVANITGSSTPSAGTGFTGTVGFVSGSGFTHSLFENRTGSSASPQTATYTDGTGGGTSTYIAGVVVFSTAVSTTQRRTSAMTGTRTGSRQAA